MPTMALVQGGCFGGGTGVISACDVVIAADNAPFSIAEVRWGLTAAIIMPQLSDAIGVRQVRRYGLTGERFGAAEARRIGFVHEVVPLAKLQAAGEKVVEPLLENGPKRSRRPRRSRWKSRSANSVDDEAIRGWCESTRHRRQSTEARKASPRSPKSARRNGACGADKVSLRSKRTASRCISRCPHDRSRICLPSVLPLPGWARSEKPWRASLLRGCRASLSQAFVARDQAKAQGLA